MELLTAVAEDAKPRKKQDSVFRIPLRCNGAAGAC